MIIIIDNIISLGAYIGKLYISQTAIWENFNEKNYYKKIFKLFIYIFFLILNIYEYTRM